MMVSSSKDTFSNLYRGTVSSSNCVAVGLILLVGHIKPGLVVHIHNPSTWEVEARSCKFKAGLSYIMRLSLDKQTKIEKKITVKMVWNSSLNTSRGDGQNRTKDKFVQTL
jgi:hypothetical protein